MAGHYLIATDFERTLSLTDADQLLGELLQNTAFLDRGRPESVLVQPLPEMLDLLLVPEFRAVRREMLKETGQRVRLRSHLREFLDFLAQGVDDCCFTVCVLAGAPAELVRAALAGIVPEQNVYGIEADELSTRLDRVALIEALESRFQTRPDHTIYVGDGGSDEQVVSHVNQRGGMTISFAPAAGPGARHQLSSNSTLSALGPILEQMGWDTDRIRAHLEQVGVERVG